MPSDTDVMIQVKADISQLIRELDNAKKALTQTQTTLTNQLAPSTTTFAGRVTAAGQKVTQLGNTIKQKIGTEGALAFAAVGAAAMSFTKQCVDSAISAESAWTQMNALLSDSNSGTGVSLDTAKAKIRNYANEWGYAVSDIRAAGNTLLTTNLDNDKLMLGLEATAGVAARTGKSFTDAATLVSRALVGNGRDFERLTGLRLDDYKTADGQIDQTRLLTDLYNQNTDAIKAHGDTTEAAVARMSNAWGRFKTDIGNALLPVVKIIGEAVEKIADWFHNLPEPAKQAIAAILLIVGAVSTVIGVLGFLAPVFIAAGNAIVWIGGLIGTIAATIAGTFGTIASVVGALGVTGTISFLFEILAGAALLVLDAIAPLIVPILAVAAAFAVLYVFGQRMGWWNDLSGMLQKFGEVIMWVAGQIGNFINWVILLFTDFPAAMDQLYGAFDGFKGMVMNALSGLWDIGVNAAQELWDGLKQRIGEMIGAIGETVGKIPGIISEKLTELGNMVIPGGGLVAGILAIFLPIPMLIAGIFMRVVQTIQLWLGQARMQAQILVGRVVQAIVTRFNQTVARVRQVFMNIVNAIRSRLNQGRAVAGNMANLIRNAIVTRFNAIIARARSIFSRIVSTIRQRLADAVNNAKAKAKEIYDGIINKIKEIPQAVADEFGKIPGKIQSALGNAASVALKGASAIVSAFLSGLQRHSPGKVQRETDAEFRSLPQIILEQGILASKAALNSARNIVKAWTDGFDGDLLVPGVEMPEEMAMISDAQGYLRQTIPNLVDNDALYMTITDMMHTPEAQASVQNRMTTQNNNSTTNNNKEVHYHVERMVVDLNQISMGEKERFYNLLRTIKDGGAV